MSDELAGQIKSWRSIADLDARAGAPVGKALNAACDEIERMQAAIALHVDCRRDISIGDVLRLMRTAESPPPAPSPVSAATEAQGTPHDPAECIPCWSRAKHQEG